MPPTPLQKWFRYCKIEAPGRPRSTKIGVLGSPGGPDSSKIEVPGGPGGSRRLLGLQNGSDGRLEASFIAYALFLLAIWGVSKGLLARSRAVSGRFRVDFEAFLRVPGGPKSSLKQGQFSGSQKSGFIIKFSLNFQSKNIQEFDTFQNIL